MHRKNAFTLIELLVVIAIIGILASILMPASLKAIEMARISNCSNNLKSIGVAFVSYAADHQGEMPHWADLPPADKPFKEDQNFSLIVLKVYTNNYVTDLRLWVCPSDKVDNNNAPVTVAKDIATFKSKYGNCSYMYISGFHLMRTAETPAVVPMLCDESNQKEYGAATPGDMPDINEIDNHGANIRNVLFLDGHVLKIKGEGAGDANAANAIFNNFVNPSVICSVD
jgi:prepilin-type N-terminal cleavage/methylation domain-containing protein/prepilin-type processing-associated H-X9-DG protein